MNILVAGGAGYIGSHAVRRLLKGNHKVTVLDNLSKGYLAAIESAAFELNNKPRFVQGDIADENLVTQVLMEDQIEAVLHFSAFIEVGESIDNPEKYYQNNLMGSFALLKAMKNAEVQKLVFSSTAAVYGNPTSIPLSENNACLPINPYGKSKLMVEWIIDDYCKAYNLGYAILRYFNVAGATPEGVIGEAHDPESHLIPRILLAAAGQSESISIFGTDYPTVDGTCIRDYIHVEDLIEGHLLALKKIQPGQGSIYNLGSESGFSVRQVINACIKITGKPITVLEQARRPGDPATLIASSAKIREELGWKRRFPELEKIVLHAWNWHQRKTTFPGKSAG
ncbi:MAG: UDP-glucose 4-epimerase GalE [Bdellovibrionia bacterium]